MAPPKAKSKGKEKASSSKGNPKSKEKPAVPYEERLAAAQKRSIIPERGLQVAHPFKAYIDAYGWHKVVEQPQLGYVELVHEFYAALPDCDSHEVQVRGRNVDASAKAINAFYGLLTPEGHRTYNSTYVDCIRAWTEKDFLHIVLAEGLRMSMSPSWVNFRYDALNPTAKAWVEFISSKILPARHRTKLPKDRIYLTYAIMKGAGIDVGQLISQRMRAAVEGNKPNDGLPFPYLITCLCNDAGVQWSSDDKTVKPKKIITPSTFAYDSSSDEEEYDDQGEVDRRLVLAQPGGSRSQPPPRTRSRTSQAGDEEIARLREEVHTMRDEQQAFFAEQRAFMEEQRAFMREQREYNARREDYVYTRRHPNN